MRKRKPDPCEQCGWDGSNVEIVRLGEGAARSLCPRCIHLWHDLKSAEKEASEYSRA